MRTRKMFIPLGILLVLVFFALEPSLVRAMDAEMLKSEKRTVIGKVEVKFDPSVNQKSATLIEQGSKKQIHIGILSHLTADFQKALVESAKGGELFEVSGTIETWDDGVVILNLRKPFKYRAFPK